MKHAFLILAHTNQEQIEMLLKILDSERIDIFMHIDSKFKNVDIPHLCTCVKRSKIYFLDRRDIRWGDLSLVSVEVDIIKLALAEGNYCYYHLISAMDMPLKPINEFLDFCERNAGQEFVNVEDWCDRKQVCLYHIFPRHQRPSNRLVYWAFKAVREALLKVQALFNVHNLRFKNIKFYKGSNWLSLSHDCATFVVSHEKEFERIYRYSSCADEKFVQTLLCNSSEYKDKLFKTHNGNLRLVDWRRGFPYVFKTCDYEELIDSPLFWARKFDIRTDEEIIRHIAQDIHHISL